MASSKYPAAIRAVAAALENRYANFDHYNLKDPLDELLFIICSTKTGEASYRAVFGKLKEAFPTPHHLAEAPAEYIAKPIAAGGLSDKKSKIIRALLDVVTSRFGEPTLEPLRNRSDREIERFLTSLPGVGKKIARCVMLYAFDRQTFPVDTHCWRLARRLGWIRCTQKDGHCSPRDMDRLQTRIPPELRFSLHVNLVSLGREFCTAAAPRCIECPIVAWCKQVGVRQADSRRAKSVQRGRAVADTG